MGFRMPKWLVDFGGKIHVAKQPPFITYNPQFHKLKGREIRNIFNDMEPGDIFVRSHDGYLSGMAIPGFWAHAGLYIGNNMVAQATTHGVMQEDVLDFFRCDSAALLRVKGRTHEMVEIALSKAKRMVKLNIPYDYDFKDFNGKVYCTELIDIVYDCIFEDDFAKDPGGGFSLTPDGLFNSKKVEALRDYRH